MKPFLPLALAALLPALAAADGLEPGDLVKVTMKGIGAAEQEKVNGEYKVGEAGGVRLPMLSAPVNAKGLTAEQFARAAEAAYKADGIYTSPAIEAEVAKGKIVNNGPDAVSVGGRVRRAGDAPYRQGLTVVQALNAAGGRDDFAGRNVMLIRAGTSYWLDYSNLKHKNIVLLPNDALQVEPRGAITDGWKGNDEMVKPLLK
ncbi:polysaccharide biosynthesis/export family protein [Luteolibacter sp. Populi]|uniref:polysaccharide biosynthesis/export family protein n=1 Tax=Luteolibacter sp. Populi TaxID=3230487 RepID=UPI0034676F91